MEGFTYKEKLERLSYLIQLLTFHVTTKNEKYETLLKNKIADLTKDEVVGVPDLKLL